MALASFDAAQESIDEAYRPYVCPPAAAPFQAAERKPKGRGGVVLSEDPPIGASPGELRVWKVERGLMDPPARVAPGAKAAGSGYAAARGRS